MQKLALAIQRTREQLLLLLGITALADIVKEFFRARLMDWAVSNFGGIGRWIIANPFALLTFGTILCLFWLLVAVMMQTTPVVSPILDSHDRQIVRPNIPGRWSLGIIGVIVLLAAAIGYGWYSYHVDTVRSTQPVPSGYTVVGHVTIAPPQDGWFSFWGMNPESDVFRVIVKTEQLSKVQEYCDVMIAVRVDDHKIDEMTDPSIEKSEPFSIILPSLTVDTVLSQKFIQRIFPNTHREGISYASVKTYLTLAPKGIKAREVRTLSDLRHLCGYILGTASMNVSISRTIVHENVKPPAVPPAVW